MRLGDEVPEGYELRAATIEDAPAIAELVNEVCLTEIGMLWTTVEETRDQLTSLGRDTVLADACSRGRRGRRLRTACRERARRKHVCQGMLQLAAEAFRWPTTTQSLVDEVHVTVRCLSEVLRRRRQSSLSGGYPEEVLDTPRRGSATYLGSSDARQKSSGRSQVIRGILMSHPRGLS